eukprot:GHVR01042418.1.p1 GENE.GHVR01042418.1~~GHVR01042418.1.p1  ORF type:complete len:104 (-),score=55.27 GHVR01042418.1:66-377(-)
MIEKVVRDKVDARLTVLLGKNDFSTLIQYIEVLLEEGATADKLTAELAEFLGKETEAFSQWVYDAVHKTENQRDTHTQREAKHARRGDVDTPTHTHTHTHTRL